MNPDEFENQLQRRPIRPVPDDWRSEILHSASNAIPRSAFRIPHPSSVLSTLNHQLSTVLWPSPKAWAALAAVWVVTAAFIYAGSGDSERVVAQSAAPSPELKMALREQRRTLAQLLESMESPAAEPPKPALPRPRGERRLERVIV